MMVPKLSLNGSVENHDFDPLARKIFRDTVAELAAKAKETLPDVVNSRVDKAVAIVLAGDVELMSDGRAVVGSQSDAGLHYVYDGECECPDSDRPEIDGWCKHAIAVAIAKRAHPLARKHLQEVVEPQPAIHATQSVSLPEVPASANVFISIQGRKVQLTLRDHDENSLLTWMETLLTRFPDETSEPEPKATPEGWCSIHQVQMKRYSNQKGSWWSHRLENGKWCRGK
jgi:hypothetical protein